MSVVIVTGQLTPEVEKSALEAGAHRCMHKPIDVETVLQVMGLGDSPLSSAALP